jgi:hypothetical protein
VVELRIIVAPFHHQGVPMRVCGFSLGVGASLDAFTLSRNDINP